MLNKFDRVVAVFGQRSKVHFLRINPAFFCGIDNKVVSQYKKFVISFNICLLLSLKKLVEIIKRSYFRLCFAFLASLRKIKKKFNLKSIFCTFISIRRIAFILIKGKEKG